MYFLELFEFRWDIFERQRWARTYAIRGRKKQLEHHFLLNEVLSWTDRVESLKKKKRERKKQPFLFNCCRRCHIIAAPLGHVFQMNMEYTTGWPNPYGANPFPEIIQLWLNLKSTCTYTPKGSLLSSSHFLSNTDYAAQHINTSD